MATPAEQPFWLTFQSSRPLQGVIMSFRGPHRFLSNFQLGEVTLPAEKVFLREGSDQHMFMPELKFPATENAYMAWKVFDPGFRKRLQGMTPKEAKAFSREEIFIKSHRPDYTKTTRVGTMYRLIQQKFDWQRHPELAEKLLHTGEVTLIEGTTWDDTLFGFCMLRGMGCNYLGRILMTVRDELRRDWIGMPPVLPGPALPEEVLKMSWPMAA